MKIHLGSFLLGVVVGATGATVARRTGSIVVVHDHERLGTGEALELARGVARRVEGSIPPPLPPAGRAPSRLAVAAARFFEEVNDDVRQASEGQADLSTLMPLG